MLRIKFLQNRGRKLCYLDYKNRAFAHQTWPWTHDWYGLQYQVHILASQYPSCYKKQTKSWSCNHMSQTQAYCPWIGWFELDPNALATPQAIPHSNSLIRMEWNHIFMLASLLPEAIRLPSNWIQAIPLSWIKQTVDGLQWFVYTLQYWNPKLGHTGLRCHWLLGHFCTG